MCRSVLRYLLIIVAIQCCTTALAHRSACAAARAGAEEQILRVQNKYQQLRSLEFDFSQTTAGNGRMKQGSGKAIFFRPISTDNAKTGRGIMRWNYTSPQLQTIVNDGKNLSIYTPQDKQMIVAPAQEMESDITYAIFTGTKNLLELFRVESGDRLFRINTPPTGLDSALLTPRQAHPQIKRVQLWFSSELAIHQVLFEDHFSALTELRFTNIRFNTLRPGDQQQAQALLTIDVAPGTEMIQP